ncbi:MULTISPECIES: host nuclease inhibitor GamL [Pantoea]|jgi:hypothetical protein|uniref:host nuclease inhibitor GamL n=1 Tax=Pantoea TaxID=53335 RepID=UPI001D899988|nr:MULTISPECIES: host nuclease inhibitor GamL [Pantoea]MBZ6387424.1 host nuclease inhibitor GamL [Pantoea piersonii]MBZ6402186.1 host nuclease inhibitor GamL [Pantoea piersonii]MBZ6410474.1 host nuclease inhibitor GamL [Pantoea piersonii]MBZ6429070.1 host nuclease inhibitor GamL [Pantoea piersonii]
MMPFIQLERRKEALDAEEQAAIEKEQWIEDEAERLLTFFPEQLYAFRHWNAHPEVKNCCACEGADDAYQDFILRLAYLQAGHNYDLQVVPAREEPAPEASAGSVEDHRGNSESQLHPERTPEKLLADFTEAAINEKTVAGLDRCYRYAARMLADEADLLAKATDVYLLFKAEIDEQSAHADSQSSGAA